MVVHGDRVVDGGGGIDRHLERLADGSDALGVVRVVMRQQDGLEAGECQSIV